MVFPQSVSVDCVPWRECKPVEDCLFTSRMLERDLATRHGQQLPAPRAAIQPHVPQHRKHLAVYRKCLMKACSVCLDSVTDDDFS